MKAQANKFPHAASVLLMIGVISGASGCSTSGNQARNAFGYGYQVTPVSNLIYRIDVKAGMTDKPESIRQVALSQACQIARSKGYSRFQIVGGEGFRTVSKNVQAGPLPLPLLRVPEGSIIVKMLEPAAAGDADTVDVETGCVAPKRQ